MSDVRFGIIGTGRITRRLVADLQSTTGVRVTAIASRTSERAEWCARQYGIAAAVEGYDTLIRRDDVDAVYIALPPSMHCDFALAAAEHGRMVMCEKPLALSGRQARQIDAACRAAGVRWLDATGWLHHQRTTAFAKMLRDGRFGRVNHVTAAVSFFEPFQTGEHRLDPQLGGGCVLDLAWYTMGLIHFAIGQTPTWLSAQAVDRDGVPVRATAMMRFADGVSATMSCGYDTSTRKWFEIAGTEASLICDDFTRPWPNKPARCWVHEASGNVESHEFNDDQETRMIRRLIDDGDLGPYQQAALRTHELLDAIVESLRTGEPWQAS